MVALKILEEESLVPFPIYMPMLHRVRNIRCLDQVLNDDCSLAVDRIARVHIVVFLVKGLGPSSITEFLKVLVHNVRRKHCVNYELAKSLEGAVAGVYAFAEQLVFFLHEQVPRQVHRILLGHTLALVNQGYLLPFLDELGISYAVMVHVMNEGLWAQKGVFE